jgi:hypothetical protein
MEPLGQREVQQQAGIPGVAVYVGEGALFKAPHFWK